MTLPAVGTNNPRQHTVTLPVITPSCTKGTEGYAELLLQVRLLSAKRNGHTSPVQRPELLEHEVALAVIVIEVVTVFRQPAARAVLTVILPLSS